MALITGKDIVMQHMNLLKKNSYDVFDDIEYLIMKDMNSGWYINES